jgi:predicted Fe-S protein YdhL (DUF1289 family)
MKDNLFILIIITGLSGGLITFWGPFVERVCRWAGCMRYTYEVVLWRHYEDKLESHQLIIPNLIDKKTERLIGQYLSHTYPEYAPFSIVSTVFVKKESVVFKTFYAWLYRACTRTADDAVREWKEERGLAI